MNDAGYVAATEAEHPDAGELDVLDTGSLVRLLVSDQRAAVDAVAAQADALTTAVDAIARRLRLGGRLHYVGAGSSGRLGALDAAEMPPTFGTAADLVRSHIAGGPAALTAAVEGAEDDARSGAAAIRGAVRGDDAVVGISASGGAAFVVAAIQAARDCGAYTAAITSVSDSPLARAAEIAVVLETGAEVLAGSTRLKAGTAQKIALNALSTAVMVRLGKVYGHLMVDVVANNRKLRARAVRLVRRLTGKPDDEAGAMLERAGGRVKVAAVMAWRDVDAETARSLLQANGDSLRSLQ